MIGRFAPFVVALLGVAAIFMATWGVRLEQCPDRPAQWRVLDVGERVGCDYQSWVRVQAGNVGLLEDVDR